MARPPAHAGSLVALQRQIGNRAVTGLLQPVSRDTSTAVAVQRDVHDNAVDAMTASMSVSERLRPRLLNAVRLFRASQLRRMRRAGVRFWGPTGMPPELDGIVQTPELPAGAPAGARASYTPTARVVRVRTTSPVSHIVHELAHAWDNLRSGRVRPVRSMLRGRDPAGAFEREHRRTGSRWWSDSRRRHRTRDAGGRTVRMTISEMLEAYRGRRILRENRFGTPGTREGYSMRSTKEFYAEGFAVFHTGSLEQRDKLRAQAPELHHLIAREAR